MQSRGLLACAAATAAALVAGVPGGASAQYTAPPEPAAYALRGVTVIRADGSRADSVTLVVRGAFIEALGRGAEVPGDARLLEGDSLMVYPGLVDGAGEAKADVPRPEVDRSKVEIWNAPREVQGFTPARRLVSYLTEVGKDGAAQRREGIVAAAVHPSGPLMPGRGALLLFRVDAETPDGLVIQPALGPTYELRGAPGVYPGTLFGVMATIRQSFEDARHQDAVRLAQAKDPRGLTLPGYDPDEAVVRQVLAGELPAYFKADAAADILRVVELADEFGFHPVIVGGGEAWKVADALKRRRIPVLVSVDFAKPRRWKPDADTGAVVLDAAAERERDALLDRYANAGRLADAGVTFALTSGGTGKILDGVRKAVANGLPEAAALQAVTATPARLFGVPELARVEAGLPATFVVSRGPLFVGKSHVVYTFVEGRLEEGDAGGAKAGAAEDAVAFGGRWSMSVDAEGQVMEAELVIEQEGATFTGTMIMQDQRLPVRDGKINGNTISGVAVMDQGGQSMEIKITGTVEGDSASGEADAGPMGVARWTAKRVGPGGAR